VPRLLIREFVGAAGKRVESGVTGGGDRHATPTVQAWQAPRQRDAYGRRTSDPADCTCPFDCPLDHENE
jgi:hypothetical protein